LNITIDQLPTINATLNALAAILLMVGWVQIKTRHERAHKILMLSAFVVSIAFLTCYLVYHFQVGSVPFHGPAGVRPVYYSILITHVILAMTVPFLAGTTIYLGLKDYRAKHRRLARWTFPIWLYVSVTGVVIYVMLYQLYPGAGETPIIDSIPAASATSEVPEAE
jgi:uncharacterized membrane protein YozB (DUF420 family)